MPTFLVTFDDLDRNVSFRSLVQQTDCAKGCGHILRDVTLEARDGDGKRVVALILLHIWDTPHLKAAIGGLDDSR